MNCSFAPMKKFYQFCTALAVFILINVSLSAQIIQGTIFEDANYGGGEGRSLIASTGSPIVNARVELYDNLGNYLNFTTTNVAGSYTFGPLANNIYQVRVVNQSVSSSRPGWVVTLFPVQTFRTDVSLAGVVSPITDRVGGEIPSEQDAPANTTNNTIAALNAAVNNEVQSITTVDLTAGIAATDVDFGFNFDLIVNTNNTGQGSLRQFILNANALGAESLLMQNGFTWNALDSVNASIPLPAGRETSIFMIADGNAHPGLRAGLINLLTSGIAIITPLTTAFNITGVNAPKTIIDGGTQTVNIGNTNNTMLGTGGTVGVGPDAVASTGDEMKLPQINGPEVELITNSLPGGTSGITISADSVTVRDFCIHSSRANDILIGAFYGTTVEQCIIGTTANSFTLPAVQTGSENIRIGNSSISGIIRNSLVGFANTAKIMGAFRTTLNVQWSIINNECAGANAGAGISFNSFGAAAGTWGLIQIKGNLCRNNSPTGISADIDYRSNPTGLMSKIMEENTCRNNGVGTTHSGIQTIQGDGNDTIRYNLIHNNAGMGIRVSKRDGASINRVKITKNSIYDNGTLGIDLDENGVSANNGTLDPSAILANNNMDYPVITYAGLSGSLLTVTGYVGSFSGQSIFGNVEIEVFKGKDDGNQNGEVVVGDGLSVPHAEGIRYLGTIFADANGNFLATIPVTGLNAGDILTATATDAMGNTSEFGTLYPFVILPLQLKNFSAVNKNNIALLSWTNLEKNYSGEFVIEKSSDGIGFHSIGFVAGNALTVNDYTYTDNNPFAGKNYYRIKQIGQDNKSYYSETRTVFIKSNSTIEWYPNPVNNFTTVAIGSNFKKGEITLINSEGKIISTQILSAAQNRVQINTTSLSKGMYHAKITLDNYTEIIHFIKE